ncbi:hypothetical protein HT031_001639 [Scenedesmus sp. PABB004]|nr:hypothetical protein HT031_001639 [Scenedesmus sp. PABB004]
MRAAGGKRRSSAAADGESSGDDGNERPAGGPAKRVRGQRPESQQPPRGAADADGGRARQERVRYSQAEAAAATDAIKRYEDEAAAAQARATTLGVPQAHIDGLVAKVVRHMLFRAHERPDVPVNRKDLVDLMKGDHKGSRAAKQLPTLVVALAAARLAGAFGLEMRELRRGALGGGGPAAAAAAAAAAGGGAGAADAGSGGQQMYVLRSLLPAALVTRYTQDASGDAARGLMTAVLGLLQVNGGPMEEEELWRHLARLGTDRDERGNAFGRDGAAGVLAHMERARYLVKSSQVAASGAPQTLYGPGEAAGEEFGHKLGALVDKWLASAGPAGGDE